MRRCPLSTRALRTLSACALLLLFPAARPARAAATAAPHIVYTSPVAGARYVRTGTALLVRFDHALAADAHDLPAFTVTGSTSGAHAGRATLADGGRALLFRPDQPFALGERVNVTVAGGVLGAAATCLSFETAAVAPTPLSASLRADLRASENTDPLAGLIDHAILPASGGLATTDTLPQNPYPRITAHVYDTPSDGDLFMASFSTGGPAPPFLLITNAVGAIVFYRQMLAMCTDFKLQPNGQLTYYDTLHGQFYAMDATYTVVDSFACGNGYATDEHELRILPNGHALLIGDDPETVDMSQVVAGGNPNATVIGNIVQELDENKNVVFEWRSWDHYAITDATHESLGASVVDYVHANALEADTDGNILISCRHMDEVSKIDRTTGALVWRWGGKNNQFVMNDPEGPFSHQHAIRRLDNGDVVLFDNGDFKTPTAYSRGAEYLLDEDNKIATLAWEYRNSPDTYGSAMGYVERLDNGNTLISWGTGKPDAIEVDADGVKVMDLSLPTGQSSYRTVRQAWNPDLAGVGDVPRAPRAAVALSVNTPNPFRGRTEMALSLGAASRVTFQVFDLAGRKVLDVMRGETRGPGLTRVSLDLSGFRAGVYFARVATERGAVSRRIVKLDSTSARP